MLKKLASILAASCVLLTLAGGPAQAGRLIRGHVNVTNAVSSAGSTDVDFNLKITNRTDKTRDVSCNVKLYRLDNDVYVAGGTYGTKVRRHARATIIAGLGFPDVGTLEFYGKATCH